MLKERLKRMVMCMEPMRRLYHIKNKKKQMNYRFKVADPLKLLINTMGYLQYISIFLGGLGFL